MTDFATEESTVLGLDSYGELERAPFTLAGRTCVRGARGSIWNEWSLNFENQNRTAYLVEAADGLTLYEDGTLFPRWESLLVGAPIDDFVVVERGQATRTQSWGKVESAPESYRYVDLSTRTGGRVAIDFDAGRVFLGRKCTMSDLGLIPVRPHPKLIPAPSVSRDVEPWLLVGDEGELSGAPCKVIALVSRSTASTRWDEYLLHDANGLRWLVLFEGVFYLASGVEAGLVREAPGSALLAGCLFTAQEPAQMARVEWAEGELPWALTIGETATIQELEAGPVRMGVSAGPRVLTKEVAGESVSWSESVRIATADVAKAFGKRALPKPSA